MANLDHEPDPRSTPWPPRRRWLASVVLLGASVTLLATSKPPLPSLGEEVELMLAPGQTVEIELQASHSAVENTAKSQIHVTVEKPSAQYEDPSPTTVHFSTVGGELGPFDASHIALNEEWVHNWHRRCGPGSCTLRLRATLDPSSATEARVAVHAVLFSDVEEYGCGGPDEFPSRASLGLRVVESEAP